MTKIRLAAVLLAAAALTACSTSEGGSPSPVKSPESGGGSTSAAQSSSSAAPSDSLTSCEILTELGLTDVKKRTGGAASTDGCTAKDAQSVQVQLNIFPTLGLSDYQPGPASQISDTTVGTRKAKLVKEAVSQLDCVVAVEISPTSRADVMAYSIKSLDEACKSAEALAKSVEPALPKS
ncbi:MULTISPECIES: DUF3558 family protein [Actinosynnema]|uniref:DUF3558 family protein n=1 Tax=Actinosynnema TaxID=40566 RepID=UPI0020A5D753|nr:DUF3558 family protein [Actinosynnema pretiosum]MCP2095543.1 Protein of unknown function (DUF3558) [Actinosynnema pretiosum]